MVRFHALVCFIALIAGARSVRAESHVSLEHMQESIARDLTDQLTDAISGSGATESASAGPGTGNNIRTTVELIRRGDRIDIRRVHVVLAVPQGTSDSTALAAFRDRLTWRLSELGYAVLLTDQAPDPRDERPAADIRLVMDSVPPASISMDWMRMTAHIIAGILLLLLGAKWAKSRRRSSLEMQSPETNWVDVLHASEEVILCISRTVTNSEAKNFILIEPAPAPIEVKTTSLLAITPKLSSSERLRLMLKMAKRILPECSLAEAQEILADLVPQARHIVLGGLPLESPMRAILLNQVTTQIGTYDGPVLDMHPFLSDQLLHVGELASGVRLPGLMIVAEKGVWDDDSPGDLAPVCRQNYDASRTSGHLPAGAAHFS